VFQDDECLGVLRHLGLTGLQARIYLALARLGVADVKTISRVSNVARQDVSRVMSGLQELGLVENGASSQDVYTAVPLRKGLLFLLQQKAEETDVLQEKTRRLIEAFDEDSVGMAVREACSQFEVTSELSVLHQKASASTNAAQKSQDSILTLAGFKVMLSYGQDVKGALGRGVRLRVVTEEPESPQAARDLLRGFEHPLLTVKYIPAPVPICMMLFDDKEVQMRMCEDDVPSLWSNNHHIINLSKKYFVEMWGKL
jgi:sugar-specific transcriptional regulator TrmB